MSMQSFKVNDTIQHVLDVGQGDPILLVHGFPLDHSMWEFQVTPLAEHYRVICPDLPGFGKSEPITDLVSIKGFADRLIGLLDAMQIREKITFCGLSMGGYIGWQFWKHYRNRVARLIACDTRASDDLPAVARGRRLVAQTVLTSGSESLATNMIEKLIHYRDTTAVQDLKKQLHQVIATTAPQSIATGQLAMAERPDAKAWLSEIDIPTLFIVGQHDAITPPEEMRQDAALVDGASFLEIPDAGHLAPWENPTDFNRGLLEFLDQEFV